MNYLSTRGGAPPVSFFDAVLAGLAPDGGLYIPDTWPSFPDYFNPREEFATGSYDFAAQEVLRAFAGDAVADTVDHVPRDAYDPNNGAPWPRLVTPLSHAGPGEWVLELFHGPSLAFKDVAMQLIGPLYEHILAERDERLTVVCATSGDTGGAAVEALKDRDRIDLFVLLPKGRISGVQRRFMTTSGAANVHAIEIDSDFDACQAIVKSLFADIEFSARARLSGVNSINWARILAQSVYFHIASNILCGPGKVSFVVPSGNFGDAFSGYVAKKMGAPIGRIGVGVNANDILARAINTGRYERAHSSQVTMSPAMDIQVASNFERILYEALDGDAEHVLRLYQQFGQSGGFDIPLKAQMFLREHFCAEAVNDLDTARAIRMRYAADGYVMCPHTAVGYSAMHAMRSNLDAPTVLLATAHPAKFPETVRNAIGVSPPLPKKCADLMERRESITHARADVEEVKRLIRERSRAWA